MNKWCLENETWDDLLRDNLGVIQPVSGYRFSMDAVLLAHFAAQLPARKVLDLGTGCGVIAILLAARLPEAQVIGIEIQAEQADRAQRSVLANRLEDRIEIINGDLKNPELLSGRNFDLITANPPFFPRGQGKLPANAAIAISRHEISCTLNDVISAAVHSLDPKGRFCLILPPGREEEAIRIGDKQGLKLVRKREVCPRQGQAVNLVLMEFRAGSQDYSLLVMPPLVVYQDDGSYTSEIMEIYYDS